MKKELSLSEIEHLADLSLIELNEQEKTSLIKQVNDIVSMLNKCDTVKIAETNKKYNVHSISDLREDVAKNSMSVSDAMRNANENINNYFSAPKVVE